MKKTEENNKKFNLIFSVLLFIFILIPTHTTAAENPPALNSKGAVLMDATTGQVLYSKDGDKQFYPASTTKVLTALVVLENADLKDIVTIGHNPPNADGTSVGIREGEQYTVEDLLYGLLMHSGNDCAEALAEHVANSNEGFAKLMNNKARELGANNSNFTNPSGLPDEKHLTTPHDLALFMKEAIKNSDFVRITRTLAYQFPASNIDGHRLWIDNGNHIIDANSSQYYYKYAVSSKKGYTTVAHFTNVASASKDGRTLIVSLLDGPGMSQAYDDSKNLFEFGFNNYTLKTIASEGDEVGSLSLDDGTIVPLLASKDIYYACDNDTANNLKIDFKYNNPSSENTKSFTRGTVLTTATVKINNADYDNVDLVSGINYNMNKSSTKNIFSNNKNEFLTGATILAIAFVIRLINVKRRKRKRARKAKLNKIINKSKIKRQY